MTIKDIGSKPLAPRPVRSTIAIPIPTIWQNIRSKIEASAGSVGFVLFCCFVCLVEKRKLDGRDTVYQWSSIQNVFHKMDFPLK